MKREEKGINEQRNRREKKKQNCNLPNLSDVQRSCVGSTSAPSGETSAMEDRGRIRLGRGRSSCFPAVVETSMVDLGGEKKSLWFVATGVRLGLGPCKIGLFRASSPIQPCTRVDRDIFGEENVCFRTLMYPRGDIWFGPRPYNHCHREFHLAVYDPLLTRN